MRLAPCPRQPGAGPARPAAGLAPATTVESAASRSLLIRAGVADDDDAHLTSSERKKAAVELMGEEQMDWKNQPLQHFQHVCLG